MARVFKLGVADGSTLGNPQNGNLYEFYDSNNLNLLTRRDSTGADLVYGTGGGIDQLGWVALTDTTYTSGSPQTFLNGVDTVLDFNADSTIESDAPAGTNAATFFNTTNNRVTSPVSGYAYIFRITFQCVPSANSRVLNIKYSIGTGVGSQIVIDQRTGELRTSGVASSISASSLIYSLGTFVTNGMQIILNPTTDCDVYDISMVLSRIN